MPKKYIFYCDYCNFKRVVDDPSKSGLVDAHRTTVQGGIPMRNKQTGKVEVKPDVQTMPRVKCPDCGRAVTARRFQVPDQPTSGRTDEQPTE